MEDRKEALILRALGKRANIALCIHGINKKYCKPCSTKKTTKSAKSAKAETAVEKPVPSAE